MDLLVLVADRDMQACLEGVLPRFPIVNHGIREFSFEVIRHPNRDPGCRSESTEFLRPLRRNYEKVLVMFDHEGCGKEDDTRDSIEDSLRAQLASNGWEENAEVIVIAPELEQWMWTPSPKVSEAMKWGTNFAELRTWLNSKGFWPKDLEKPNPPKEAFETALRHQRLPRSASIYEKIAKNASFKDCTDPAFLKLISVLENWFPNQ